MKKSTLFPVLSGLFISTSILTCQVRADDTAELSNSSISNTNVASTLSETAVTLKQDNERLENMPLEETNQNSIDKNSSENPIETGDRVGNQASTTNKMMTAMVEKNEKQLADQVTIYHTNDIHGRIEESSDSIGMGKLAGAVEASRSQGTTLLLDSGDAFQGLPISNSSQGEDMAAIMNQMGYDAMAVGNHEFDFGLDQLKKLKELLTFPLLSSNIYVDGARLFQASTIIDKTPDMAGDEFVVIGVSTPETATKTFPKNVSGLSFTDPIAEVNKVIEQIEATARAEEKTYHNYIILAHLGTDLTTPLEWRGTTLAEALSKNSLLSGKKVIVLDGHSHSLKTEIYGNVTYNQTGSNLSNIGQVVLNSDSVLSAGVLTSKDVSDVAVPENIIRLINSIHEKYQAQNAQIIKENNPVELSGKRENVRVRETNLGDLVADALLDYGQTGFSHRTDLAVINGGGLRDSIKKDQAITKGDIIAVVPFGNVITQIKVTGEQIYEMFVKSLGAPLQQDGNNSTVLDENAQPLLEPSGGFLQVAGVRVMYDTNLPADKRILAISIWNPETKRYDRLDKTKIYYLATNDFLAAGGDGYTMLGGAREEGTTLDTILVDYLTKIDLMNYAVINPNSRTISISSQKDTDGDGYPDYVEILAGTLVDNANNYPGIIFDNDDKDIVSSNTNSQSYSINVNYHQSDAFSTNHLVSDNLTYQALPATSGKSADVTMLFGVVLIVGLGTCGLWFKTKEEKQK